MATITTSGSGNWSSTTPNAPWPSGIVPVLGDSVTIALGHTVTLDGAYSVGDDTANAVVVNGTLKASRSVDSQLTIRGDIKTAAATTATIDFGRKSTSDIIPTGVTATLILNSSAAMADFKWGLRINDTSNAYFCGAERTRNTVLISAVLAGDTSCVVADATGWEVDDWVVLAETTGSVAQYDRKQITSITNGSGTQATVGFSALTYPHAAQCPVGNFTSNVTIKNFDTAKYAYLSFQHTSTTSNNRREIDNIALEYCGSTNLSNLKYLITGSGINVTPFLYFDNVAVTMSSLFFMNAWFSPSSFTCSNWAWWNASGGNTLLHFASGTTTKFDGLGIYCAQASMITSSFSQGGQGAKFTNCKLWATTATFAFISVGDGLVFENCDMHTAIGANGAAYTQSGTAKFINCRIGHSSLPGTPLINTIHNAGTAFGQAGLFTFEDCLFAEPAVAQYANLTLPSETYAIAIVNKNQDVTAQEYLTPLGVTVRDNSTRYRSTSSHAINPIVADQASSRQFKIFAPNGVNRRVVGYVRYDSTYGAATPPVVTLSGLGITPQTYTAGGSADTWYQFDLSATQTSGADGNLTLTVAGQSTSTSGNFWIDGIIDPPFVTSCRHYGFLFDNLIYRAVDPVTLLNESAAGALTGISIAGSTITLTANRTIRELYDYCKWYLCQTANLTVADFFTSSDGVNFTSSYNLTLNGGNLTGSGSLSLGAATFTRASSETSSIPITYDSGAAVFTSIMITGLIAGSRVYLKNTTDDANIYNEVVAETSASIPITWTVNKTIRLRVQYTNGLSSYLPYEASGVLSNTGASFLVSQLLDSVYNTNAINGASVTEFVADYPNVQVDIDDADGVTSVQRLYAWFRYNEFSASGIEFFQGGIVADDLVNYQIRTGIIDLSLDNTSPLPVIIAGARIYRDDNLSIIYSGSGSIQIDPSKAYIATGDVASAATIASAVRTELSTELGRVDVATSTRLATAGYTAPDNAGITAIEADIAALTIPSPADVAAIKAKTDSLTFTVAGKIDANIHHVNDVEVAGTGTELDPWNPA